MLRLFFKPVLFHVFLYSILSILMASISSSYSSNFSSFIGIITEFFRLKIHEILGYTIFFNTEVLNLPVALFLKVAGYIGFILFALALRKLLLYLNRPDQVWKVHCLLGSVVLFLLGSWFLELVTDLGLVGLRLITIYSVMLVGFFLYPCFTFSLKKVLR